MATMCTAIAKGNRKECLRPVAESSDLSLCAFHLLMAHQMVLQLGGVQVVAAMIRKEASL